MAPRPRLLLAALLVIATIVFVGGVVGERSTSDEHGGEVAESQSGRPAAEEAEERLFGVNAESPALISGAVVLSLALAAAVLWSRARALLLVVAAFGLAFAVLDIREVVHQLSEANGGLVAVALLAAALHLGAGLLALRLDWRSAAA